MKLYSNGLGVWVGTQAEAKQFDCGPETIDVPTDKPGLLQFLNSIEAIAIGTIDHARRIANAVDNADRHDHGQLEPEEQSTPKTVVNGWDLKAAADTASLQDLQYVVYKYMMRIDDELDLKKAS